MTQKYIPSIENHKIDSHKTEDSMLPFPSLQLCVSVNASK